VGSGQILQSPGTSSAAAYGFTTSSNTGLYSPGPGMVGLTANGSAALTIDGAGNLAIGGSSPTGTEIIYVKSNAISTSHNMVSTSSNIGATSYFSTTNDLGKTAIFGIAGSNYTGPYLPNSAFIQATGTSGLGTMTISGPQRFMTGGSGVANERMRIDLNGHVG